MKKIVTKMLSKIKTKTVPEKRLKLKLVLYFLIGLFFHIFGLIVAGVWIRFRTKFNKGAKFRLLLFGFIITMLISFSGNLPFVKSLTNNAIFAKFPVVKPVYQAVQKAYPTYDIGYNVVYNTFYSSSGTKKSSQLSINLASTKDLPAGSEYYKVGKLVCTTLRNENGHFDMISIHFSKEYGFLGITLFNYSLNYNGSCTSFLSKK